MLPGAPVVRGCGDASVRSWRCRAGFSREGCVAATALGSPFVYARYAAFCRTRTVQPRSLAFRGVPHASGGLASDAWRRLKTARFRVLLPTTPLSSRACAEDSPAGGAQNTRQARFLRSAAGRQRAGSPSS